MIAAPSRFVWVTWSTNLDKSSLSSNYEPLDRSLIQKTQKKRNSWYLRLIEVMNLRHLVNTTDSNFYVRKIPLACFRGCCVNHTQTSILGFPVYWDFPYTRIPLIQGFPLYWDFPYTGISLILGFALYWDSPYTGIRFILGFPLHWDSPYSAVPHLGTKDAHRSLTIVNGPSVPR